MKNTNDLITSPFLDVTFRCTYQEAIQFYLIRFPVSFNRCFTASATKVAVLHPAVSFITQVFWLMKQEE